MKKLILFEILLILFFVLAWNVSKADNKPEGYCELTRWLINNHAMSLEDYYEGLWNAQIVDYEDMRKKEDRLLKLSTLYKNICD